MDIGKIIGGGLLLAGTAAIWMWPDAKAPEAAPEPVRPVRSAVAKVNRALPDLSFTGRIKATETRALRFKQSGRILRIPVSKGQHVRAGEKLAWLDAHDFENALAKAEAAEKRDRLSFERKRDAARKNAVSQEEVSQAEAQLRQSEAQLALARRALEETVLTAPFDSVVADIAASELDMAGPDTAIVTIQDMSKVKVDVAYPETLVIVANRIRTKCETSNECAGVTISMDSAPERKFPASFVEFTATADAKTQTYIATYVMDYPEDLLLLPGMSATLTVSGEDYYFDDGSADDVSIPDSAVGVDASGAHFAWKLEPTEAAGIFRVTACPLELGSAIGKYVSVRKGLAAGDRVATAGIAVLSEGRRVRLIEE